eukprot:TRINITY_DN551_c0_g3_i1.p1 TRINITY_DN551_c0_g3~~TRINITY_DN551_c0_g3_i1.p1  ORF type:complete len:1202 (+),score=344.34 TRINITY_DN551_c0_g3_i1:77-3682(+)
MPDGLLCNKSVRRIVLLRQRPWWGWLVIWPFCAVYAVQLLGAVAPELLWVSVLGLEEQYKYAPSYFLWGARLSIPPLVFAHVLATLFTIWNATVRSFVFYSRVSSPSAAHSVLVCAQPHKGDNVVTPVLRDGSGMPYFRYQDRRYTWNPAVGLFTKPELLTRRTVGELSRLTGLSDAEAAAAAPVYGPNKFSIRIPEFRELMLEHLLSPFFVFQMFCVLLWLLDEYWYYSVFTGIMLWIFEATVVKQRLSNMHRLLSMEQKAYRVTVLRGRQWKQLGTHELLPRDIVWLQRTAEGAPVPCDVLLLEGTAVADEALLTGETTPQMKESIAQRPESDVISTKEDKVHILFGGTRILMCAPRESPGSDFPPKGGNGAIGVVLRTGFETSQGKLVRKIMHTTDRVSANNGEAFAFIGCLLVFAVAASAYVLHRGLQDPNRSRWKLMLSCALIITSVVPPELPMELSLAVNTSLLHLHRLHIYCTEPFRIPFAGSLDTCCFDKTGTLTADVMIMDGIYTGAEDRATIAGSSPPLIAVGEGAQEGNSTLAAQLVLAGCNSLAWIDGEPVGDSMERCALDAIGWHIKPGGQVAAKGRRRVSTLIRYPFQSALKRMSAVVDVAAGAVEGHHIVCKGAPEAVLDLLEREPDGYVQTYRAFSRAGGRVLALAVRQLPPMPVSQLKQLRRSEAEQRLTFAGFAVFSCPMRPDARDTVRKLQGASQRVVMITGDNELTAAWVARELGIAPLPPLFLHCPADGPPEWQDPDGAPAPALPPARIAATHSLVVSGEHMARCGAVDPAWLRRWADRVSVFARCAPTQKESVLVALNSLGRRTLMCGDGTNDVGALRQAHVGVGLLGSAPPHTSRSAPARAPPPADRHPLSIPERPPEDPGIINMIQWKLRERRRQRLYREHLAAVAAAAQGGRRRQPDASLASTLAADWTDEEDAFDDTTMVQLGDASIASPFTARDSSTMATCHLLRLGRCTLVTTLQMYKILALNCLISAYSLSVLTSDGVKLGDTQMTVTGLVITVCFLFISRSQPLESLSECRPHARVFCPYMVLSILLQFGIHLYYLISAVQLVAEVEVIVPPADFDEHKFQPTLLNTVVFLVVTLQEVCTFANNYQGHPFMTGLTDNKPLLYGLGSLVVLIVLCTLEFAPWFNEYIELVPLPSADFRWGLLLNMGANVLAVGIAEMLCLRLFPPPRRRSSK